MSRDGWPTEKTNLMENHVPGIWCGFISFSPAYSYRSSCYNMKSNSTTRSKLIFLIVSLRSQWPTGNSHVRIITNFSYKNRRDCEMILADCSCRQTVNTIWNFVMHFQVQNLIHFFLIINKSVFIFIRYGASWLWSPWFSSSRQRPSRPSILILIK